MSTTNATPKTNGNTTEATLYMAFELNDKSWKMFQICGCVILTTLSDSKRV